VRTEATEPPTFTALGQWTRMTVVGPNGESRSYTRAEARDLGNLVGSAALAAVGPQPLRSKVEWRVTLERNGKPMAQFELARGEVRWRESGSPAATGQPPEGALEGLREALRDALATPPPVAAPPAAPPSAAAPADAAARSTAPPAEAPQTETPPAPAQQPAPPSSDEQ
jgi:hypothetical protein